MQSIVLLLFFTGKPTESPRTIDLLRQNGSAHESGALSPECHWDNSLYHTQDGLILHGDIVFMKRATWRTCV